MEMRWTSLEHRERGASEARICLATHPARSLSLTGYARAEERRRLAKVVAVVREDDGIPIVDAAPRGRIPHPVRGGGVSPGVCQHADAQFDDVAGLPSDIVYLLRAGPRLPVIRTPEEMIGHAAMSLLPVRQHRPVLAGFTLATVANNHDASSLRTLSSGHYSSWDR